MSDTGPLLKELLRIKDELNLQAHLFEMDVRSEWQRLCFKLTHLEAKLEQDLLALSQKIGRAEEELFVEDEQELRDLISEFKQFDHKTRVK